MFLSQHWERLLEYQDHQHDCVATCSGHALDLAQSRGEAAVIDAHSKALGRRTHRIRLEAEICSSSGVPFLRNKRGECVFVEAPRFGVVLK